jgi:hypothetical protein
MLAYRFDGIVNETTDWQPVWQRRTRGHVRMEGSRNMLFIADILVRR